MTSSNKTRWWEKYNPEKRTIINIGWYTRHQHEWDDMRRKKRCHSITVTAIRFGIISRPSCCQKCGVECQPNAHHEDYSRLLDVQFYCRPCHNAADREREERLGITRKIPLHRHLPMTVYNRAMRLWATGNYSQREIGRKLNIANCTVSKWVRGLTQPRQR